ncbi:hypothetical protein JW916_13615 [Candidatus Sumerlaeota bacterium]|nr:hypothetical protein [Candidatus Sumerlaeota bacterium]
MNTSRTVLTVVVTAVVVAGLALVLRTRPAIQEEAPAPAPTEQTPAVDPLSVPLVSHMRNDEGIDIGPDTSHALAVSLEGDHVRVVVSDALIEKLGADLLPRLGMVENEESMSWDHYKEFLDALHDAVVAAEGGEHHHDHEDHDHEGEHEETEHE